MTFDFFAASFARFLLDYSLWHTRAKCTTAEWITVTVFSFIDILFYSQCKASWDRKIWQDEHIYWWRWTQHWNALAIHCKSYGEVSSLVLFDVFAKNNNTTKLKISTVFFKYYRTSQLIYFCFYLQVQWIFNRSLPHIIYFIYLESFDDNHILTYFWYFS